MLKLWSGNVIDPANNPRPDAFIAMLDKASSVEVSQEINGDYSIEFKYPKNEISFILCDNVEYEGQLYRISRISETEEALLSIKCEHIFIYDAKRTHLPNVASTDSGDFIGEDAYNVIDAAIEGTGFSHADVDKLGYKRISTNIDFESVDKTTLYDVIMQVIENAGMGELYVDNYSFAVVERIGEDRDTIIAPGINLTDYTVERDCTELITRFYPYGKDNMEITNAAKNTSKLPYIESSSGYLRGRVYHGYKDYSDCTDPDSLLERALWEFDELNPDRIDVPAVNISGQVTDCREIGLGDRVCVILNGETTFARVISLKRDPFEATPDSVSIGRVKKDMYYYLSQVGAFTKRYKKVSTTSGKVQGLKVSGTVKTTSKASSAASVVSSDGRVKVDSGGVKIYGAVLTADNDGNMYINGKKIRLEDEK